MLLLWFSISAPEIEVNSPTETLNLSLRWKMTGVSKIQLHFFSPDIPGLQINDVIIPYPSPQPPLQYDNYTLIFQGVTQSGSLQLTATAYDANGNELNDLQQTVGLDFPPMVTGYTGNMQADGSILLSWTTEGAMISDGVTTAFSNTPFTANAQTTIPARQPLLNNAYYALTAHGPNQSSAPCVFRFGKHPFAPIGSIDTPNDPNREQTLLGIIADPQGKYAVLIGEWGQPVYAIDISGDPPFQALSPINSPDPDPLVLYTVGTAVSPSGDYIFVADIGNDNDLLPNTVSVLSTRTTPPFQLSPEKITVGRAPLGIACSPKGDYAFVVNVMDATVSVVDISKGPPFQTLSPAISGFGAPPDIKNNTGVYLETIAVSPPGDYVFVTDGTTNTLIVIDLSKGPPFQVLPTKISLGNQVGPMAVTLDGKYVFVATLSTLYVLDLRNGPPFQLLQPDLPAGDSISLSPDGHSVWIGNSGNNTISVIDLRNGPPFRLDVTINLNAMPLGIAFTTDGMYAFAAIANNSNYYSVSVLGPASASAFPYNPAL